MRAASQSAPPPTPHAHDRYRRSWAEHMPDGIRPTHHFRRARGQLPMPDGPPESTGSALLRDRVGAHGPNSPSTAPPVDPAAGERVGAARVAPVGGLLSSDDGLPAS